MTPVELRAAPLPEQIVTKLRADLKPKREWRVTKAGLQAEVFVAQRRAEQLATENHELRIGKREAERNVSRLAALCLFLAAFAAVVGVW